MWFVFEEVNSRAKMPLAMCVKSLVPPEAVSVSVVDDVPLISLHVMLPGVNEVKGTPVMRSMNGPMATLVPAPCSNTPRSCVTTLGVDVRFWIENRPTTARTLCESTVPDTTMAKSESAA